MNRSVQRFIPTLVSSLVLGAVTSHAFAGAELVPIPPAAMTVHFADLNLSTQEGIKGLYTRIRGAAHEVCQASGDWYPTEHWADVDCYRATVNRVVAKLNLPRLTALHLQTTGATSPPMQADNRQPGNPRPDKR